MLHISHSSLYHDIVSVFFLAVRGLNKTACDSRQIQSIGQEIANIQTFHGLEARSASFCMYTHARHVYTALHFHFSILKRIPARDAA